MHSLRMRSTLIRPSPGIAESVTDCLFGTFEERLSKSRFSEEAEVNT